MECGGDAVEQVMICLVGEQPVPNLLPIRHCKPNQVVLVCSQTTKRVSDNLERLLKGQFTVSSHEVPPYDIVDAQRNLEVYLSQQGWQGADLLFNLTGGTKPMSLAAFLLAQKLKSAVIYMESEGGQSLLYRYEWLDQLLKLRGPEIIQEKFSIDDYLKAHVGTYSYRKKKDDFSQLLHTKLQPHVDEILVGVSIDPNIEIDLIIRCGNNIGVAEVTTGRADKEKIDQLHSLTERGFLGTYIKRLLISAQQLELNNSELARAYGITVIDQLQVESGRLLRESKKRLINHVSQVLRGKR